jgi:hypothetical protein
MAVRQTIASANNRTARLRRHRLLVSRDLEAAEGVGQKKSSSPSFRPASLDLATRSASAAQEAASQAFRSSCGLRSSPASDFKANFALSGSRVGSGGAVKRVGARTAEVRGSNPLSSTKDNRLATQGQTDPRIWTEPSRPISGSMHRRPCQRLAPSPPALRRP